MKCQFCDNDDDGGSSEEMNPLGQFEAITNVYH